MFLILKKNKFVFDDDNFFWKTPFAVTTEALTYDSPTLDSRFTHHSPLSLSHTQNLTETHKHTHSISLTHTATNTHSHTLTLTLSHTHTHICYFSMVSALKTEPTVCVNFKTILILLLHCKNLLQTVNHSWWKIIIKFYLEDIFI